MTVSLIGLVSPARAQRDVPMPVASRPVRCRARVARLGHSADARERGLGADRSSLRRNAPGPAGGQWAMAEAGEDESRKQCPSLASIGPPLRRRWRVLATGRAATGRPPPSGPPSRRSCGWPVLRHEDARLSPHQRGRDAHRLAETRAQTSPCLGEGLEPSARERRLRAFPRVLRRSQQDWVDRGSLPLAGQCLRQTSAQAHGAECAPLPRSAGPDFDPPLPSRRPSCPEEKPVLGPRCRSGVTSCAPHPEISWYFSDVLKT